VLVVHTLTNDGLWPIKLAPWAITQFRTGTVVYTIADGGVDLAPFHEFDSAVPQSIKDEIVAIKQMLIDGSLTVDGVLGQ
jgi:basic membrane lipoprotein Med (substrate-binding protein (PBP1-ABC) superfamily)